MGGAPQVAIAGVASQIWQIVFASQTFQVFVFALQTLQVFRLALRKKAQYVIVFHLHIIHPPSYPIDLNFSPAYNLTINPLLTLAKLLSPLG